jgi:uncharacterized protein YdaU (DUF1376 family)
VPPKTKSPAFQWYPRDFLADALVQSMTLEQEGAYRRLMDICWLEHGLPDDMDELWRLAKAPSKERFTRNIWPLVGRKFQQRRGRLQHKRLDKERAKQAKTRKARQLAAHGRWDKDDSKCNANASDLQCLTSSSASAPATAVKKDQNLPTLARRDARTVEKLLKAGSDDVSPALCDQSGDPGDGAGDAGCGVESSDQGTDVPSGLRVSTAGDAVAGDECRSGGTRAGEWTEAVDLAALRSAADPDIIEAGKREARAKRQAFRERAGGAPGSGGAHPLIETLRTSLKETRH